MVSLIKVSGTAALVAMLAVAGVSAAQEATPAPAGVAAEVTPQSTIAPVAPAPAAVATAPEGAAAGDSHVRIVRLSDIKGKVGMDRGTGHGIEQTMQNMPIAQGMTLGTAEGYAEVEFEDGSTLRLAPNTIVQFPLLVLRASGVKATIVQVDQGTVYVSSEKSKDSEFTLATGKTRIVVSPGTHLRMEITAPKAELAVFQGNAAVQADGAPVMVGKKQTLTLDTANNTQTEVAKGIEESPFDAWDKDSLKYHEHYGKANALLGSSSLYGVSDLNYYGSFVNAGGCGMMWQPYFVSASWSPYSNGLWAMYPGAGYSWVSPYPWGWLPFHTGSWNYCPSRGWGWQPGGSWYGLRNVTMINPGPAGGGVGVHGMPAHPPGMVGGPHPPRPPAGMQSMVVAGSAPAVRSTMQEDSFIFRRDSAGLGVPRGSLGNLHGISNDVVRHGFANREVYASPEVSSRGFTDHNQRPVPVPMTLHRGPSPDGMASGGGRFDWKNGQRDANGQQRPGVQAGQNSPGHPTNNMPNSSSGMQNRSAGSNGSFHGGGGGQPGGGYHGGGSPGGQMGGGGGGSYHGGGGASGGGGGNSGGGGRSGGTQGGAPH